MFSLRVKEFMDRRKLLLADPETTVLEACKRMAARKTGAVLVMQSDRLVGIFTERDAVWRVLAVARDPKSTCLRDVMTAWPKTIESHHSMGYAMLVMHENGFRHLPVVDGGRLVGIVSARNALDPDLEEFVSESRRREHIREEG